MYLTFAPAHSTLPHKLADGILHFDDEPDNDLFQHVVLMGVEVWHQRDDPAILYVTLPQRQSVRRHDNGIARYTLFRMPDGTHDAAVLQTLREGILAQYRQWVAQAHAASHDGAARKEGAQ